MTVKYLYLIFALVLTLPACSIEDRIERREDRLLGSWVIDRATYKDDDKLFRDNVIADFEGDIITFFADYTLLYEAGNGETFDGFWAIDALRDRDDDLEFAIDADFFDFRGRVAFRWLGTIDRLTDNDFNVNVAERGGLLRLKWDRF